LLKNYFDFAISFKRKASTRIMVTITTTATPLMVIINIDFSEDKDSNFIIS
jgi:hypothetical protein